MDNVTNIQWTELTLGARIKRFRQINDLKASDVAKEAEISKGYMSDVENDKRNITVPIALRLCKALRVSPQWLLTGSEVSK